MCLIPSSFGGGDCLIPPLWSLTIPHKERRKAAPFFVEIYCRRSSRRMSSGSCRFPLPHKPHKPLLQECCSFIPANTFYCIILFYAWFYVDNATTLSESWKKDPVCPGWSRYTVHQYVWPPDHNTRCPVQILSMRSCDSISCLLWCMFIVTSQNKRWSEVTTITQFNLDHTSFLIFRCMTLWDVGCGMVVAMRSTILNCVLNNCDE